MARKSSPKLVRASDTNPSAGERMPGASFSTAERETVRSARALAESYYQNVVLASGEPALGHAAGTLATVSELKLDGEALAAALLAPAVQLDSSRLRQIRERCGAGVAELVEGVARMEQIHALSSRPPSAPPVEQAAQLEALRKMLLAMVQDMRVVLVKLASHTQELRFLVRSGNARMQRERARHTHDLYAPLANRMGVWQLKWEMEDLAFRILMPDIYRGLARRLDGKRADRERYIKQVIAQLQDALNRSGIVAEVSGRPKHIFSIYRKMSTKDIDFKNVYDVRALRILVPDVADCYAALGVAHNLWTPIPGEFDDYIAKPKSNQYRSLHTAVVGPENKALEVQIRTHEMHRLSELGVAAHWRYKEGSRREQGYDQKIAWLRQVLEWRDDAGDAGGLAERFRTGLFDDTIYVLTPRGRVIALTHGATPIDFAYHVHTELGHRCRGAKVDGAMVPLNTPLANGQQVEILAARQGGPSRDWLNTELGYVRSASARARIRQWFNRRHFETAVAEGRAVVDEELRRQGMTRLSLDKLAAHLGYAKADAFLADAGRGEIRSRQLELAAHALDPRAESLAPGVRDRAMPLPPPAHRRPSAPRKGGVLVVGVDRLLTVPAKCCRPVPPDAIVGFVTRGRGVTVHRAGCGSLDRLDAKRRVAADWGDARDETFEVDIEIVAAKRPGLLREIADVVTRARIRVVASRAAQVDATVRLRYTMAVADLSQLGGVLQLLRRVRGVARAQRYRQAPTGKGKDS